MDRRFSQVKALLEKLYVKYSHRACVPPDPLQFIYHYSERRDVEIAAFLAAALAYGRVQQIERSLSQLFDRMDHAPGEFAARFNATSRAKLRSFKHRFTTGDDVSDLLALFRRVFDDGDGLEAFFLRGYRPEDTTVLPALRTFCDSLWRTYTDGHGRTRTSGGLGYLLASPSRGSASKRLHLFLRWMVRCDEVDVGLWTRVDKAKLIVPLDVHMGRLCRILGLHDHKTISLATARQVTEGFAKIEPGDPVKYDFALSRIGILENCTGRCRPACTSCELYDLCTRQP